MKTIFPYNKRLTLDRSNKVWGTLSDIMEAEKDILIEMFNNRELALAWE